MKSILITGAIGSGKTQVGLYLESLGYPLYYCDDRTKSLYSSVAGLKEKIEKALEIKWEQIGIIFEDKDRKEKLESIVYPYVVEDIKKWKAEQKSRIVFIESALAMDNSLFDDLYDEVLLITADYSIRVKRNPKTAQRDSLQSFDPSKVDYIIENDSSLENLYSKIDNLLCRLI